MQCPTCGAPVNSAFCEYCGTKMPIERIEASTINAQNVTVNNYYGQPQYAQQPNYSLQPNQFAAYSQTVSPKSRLVALLLCIFLGLFGAHRFYAGHLLLGVVYLLTAGVLGIGWLVDIVLICLGKMHDKYGLAIVTW